MAFEQRLPAIDGDDGQWGDILNQFLIKEHHNTGLDDPTNGSHKNITIQPGTIDAGTAPLKFTSGPLLTNAEAGAVEFLTDKLYITQTTNSTRKTVAIYDDNSGATGDLYYRDNNGNFIRLPIGSIDGQIMRVSSGVPVWATVLNGADKITVNTIAPSSPTIGDLWIDTN